jgi:hypothetical protein
MVLPSVDFLAPGRWLAYAHLNSELLQIALCVSAGLAICSVLVQHAVMKSWVSLGKRIVVALFVALTYVGGLEVAQLLTADRHARWVDFESNALAIVVALGVVFALAGGGLLLYQAEERMRVRHYKEL